MAANETFRASVIMEGNLGTAVVYDFGYVDNSGGGTHIDTGTAAGDFQTLVQATLVAALPTHITFKKYRFACVGGTHLGEIGYVDVPPDTVTGSDESDVLPMEICISLKRATGYASRRDRGRVFFGPCIRGFQSADNVDKVVPSPYLEAVRDLLKANLVTQTVTLKPVILAGNGTYNGRLITKVAIGEVFTHRKSRRWRVGV